MRTVRRNVYIKTMRYPYSMTHSLNFVSGPASGLVTVGTQLILPDDTSKRCGRQPGVSVIPFHSVPFHPFHSKNSAARPALVRFADVLYHCYRSDHLMHPSRPGLPMSVLDKDHDGHLPFLLHAM